MELGKSLPLSNITTTYTTSDLFCQVNCSLLLGLFALYCHPSTKSDIGSKLQWLSVGWGHAEVHSFHKVTWRLWGSSRTHACQQTNRHNFQWHHVDIFRGFRKGHQGLTHIRLDKIAANSQTISSDAWWKSFVFLWKFHWSLFLKVNLKTTQFLFR